jgi:hypothetical protein
MEKEEIYKTVNFDYVSLYPNTFTTLLGGKKYKRKVKIKKIFNYE